MATSKKQRIGILVIAVVMVIGTIFSFFAIILQNSNAQLDAERIASQQEELEREFEKYNEEYTAYQDKLNEESEAIEAEYGKLIKKYEDRPGKFDPEDITELETEDLEKGDGKKVESANDIRAYYIGWNKDGVVFDSSIDDDGNLKAPLDLSMGVIEGWQQGVVGMNVGGVREISIPSELAYGEQSPGDDIPANSDLMFVVVALPPSKHEVPEMSPRLEELMSEVGPGAMM